MKKHVLLLSFAITGLLLTACGGRLEQSSAPATKVITVTAAPEAPAQASSPQNNQEQAKTASVASQTEQMQPSSSATTTVPKDDGKCGSKSVDQAIADNIQKVPEHFPGDDGSSLNNHPGSSWISETSVSDYDPCADLSWVILHTNGASAAIPYQIMLFHKDQYIGTPAKVAFAMFPVVKRLSGNEIQVGYRWAVGHESLAEAQVRATSTFTYNPSTGGVDHAGQWPKSEIISSNGTLPIDAVYDRGVAHRAGGDIPGNAYQSKSFQTPSGNIKCSIGSNEPVCWEISNKKTIKLGGYNNLPKIANDLNGIGNGDLPTADYGSTVYSTGGVACAIEENGVTCWNNQNGHGAFISKQDTFTF